VRIPFSVLGFLDSPGLSSTVGHGWRGLVTSRPESIVAVVLDIECWAAKHSMELVREVQATFSNVIIVANKADQLNRHEIDRIRVTVPRRLKEAGVTPVPLFAVSAELERGRGESANEVRLDTRPGVLTACDTGFDALRLHLYEWESRFMPSMASTDDLIVWASATRTTSN
jgi:hypothetical protein